MQQNYPHVYQSKVFRRIMPGLRRMKHLRNVVVRNIKNESIAQCCRLYFTLHCNVKLDVDTRDDTGNIYQSEVVVDTVNPDWNEFGCPIGISEIALDEKDFTLRIWNKDADKNTIIIESSVDLQDLDYIMPVETTESEDVSDVASAETVKIIFNALPYNAILYQMDDGYFASHDVCCFLRRKNVLKSIYIPELTAVPSGAHSCDYHFTLTSLQQLYLQQSRSLHNDERMSLMKDMVTETMREPMATNSKNVESKCLINEIRQLKEEESTLQRYFDDEQKMLIRIKGELEESRQNLLDHYSRVSDYEVDMSLEEEKINNLKTTDISIQESLHARRTRLLAMLSFLYPITRNGHNYAIKGMILPEILLRTTGPNKDTKIQDTNVAFGYLCRIVQLLSKYFVTPLPYTIEYRSSASVIYDPHIEPFVQNPLYIGGVTGSLANAVTMMREDVKSILKMEGINLGMEEDMLSGLDSLIKHYLVL